MNNPRGKYYFYDERGTNDYAHATSPIRRWVDIYNQYMAFYGKDTPTTIDIHELNEKSRQIKKVQMESAMLACCQTIDSEQLWEGQIVDEENNVYTVYLPKLKLVSSYKTGDAYEIGSVHRFRIFFFQDEYRTKKKVRINIAL
jgi:exoribonuclease R